MKRLFSLWLCNLFFLLPLFAEETYSLKVQTRKGHTVALSFTHTPIVVFEKDSVIISAEDMRLLLSYDDVVLSFIDHVPNSINNSSQDAISFSINQRTIIGNNIPPSCAVRFYTVRGELLRECKPNNNGIVKYDVDSRRDKVIIVNTSQVGFSFKMIIP